MTLARVAPKRLAVLLALVPFMALGLARFAYGLLLPSMRADLGWTYSAAGAVTTANSAGYLIGALIATRVLARRSAIHVVVGTTWATAALLIANGLSANYVVILMSRLGAGVTTGLAFVAGGVLAARLVARDAPRAMMLYPAGAGAGIVFSALAVPLTVTTPARWTAGWITLGITTALVALLVGYFWWDEDSVATPAKPPRSAGRITSGLQSAEIAYFLFGLGYIAYVTFVVAYLRNAGADDNDIIGFWMLLGIASIIAALVWPRLTHRYDLTLTATLAGCAAGVGIVVVSPSIPTAATSAVLFGGSFLAVVSSVTGLARDRLPPEQWAGAIARMTVIFGAGQTLGPVLAGLLGDTDAGLRVGLAASVVALTIGAFVSVGSFQNLERQRRKANTSRLRQNTTHPT